MAFITRHLHLATAPYRAMELERLWHQEIAGLLARQPGCQRVVLLRHRERPGEYVGVTEWQTQEALGDYMASDDFRQLLRLLHGISLTAPTLNTYETVSS
jgi:heme-degrading monooxygenase HmoA